MKMLSITAKRDGFRRAGIAHAGTTVEHPAKNFTRAQIAELKEEPMLVVHEFDAPDPKEPPAPKDLDPKK